METDKFKEFLARIDKGEELSHEEQVELDSIASALLDQMQSNSIEYENQNLLDLYVTYFDGSTGYLDPTKTQNIMRYYTIIDERNEKKLAAEKKEKPRVLKIEPIDHNGVISGIAIIEVVLLLGILLSFIAIALLGK